MSLQNYGMAFYTSFVGFTERKCNEMKDIIDFVNYEKNHGRQCEIEADRDDILQYVQKEMLNLDKYNECI